MRWVYICQAVLRLTCFTSQTRSIQPLRFLASLRFRGELSVPEVEASHLEVRVFDSAAQAPTVTNVGPLQSHDAHPLLQPRGSEEEVRKPASSASSTGLAMT